jgi:hypothetical protein
MFFLWMPMCNRIGKLHLPLLAAPPMCYAMAYFLYIGVRIEKNTYGYL